MKKFLSRVLHRNKESRQPISPELQEAKEFWEAMLSGDINRIRRFPRSGDLCQKTKAEVEEIRLRLNEIERKLSISANDTIERKLCIRDRPASTPQ